MTFSYRGKVALITGASAGIGAGFARELAARGMTLILVARNEAALDALAAELKSTCGVPVHVIPADLSREAAAAEVTAAVAERGLAVDLLVNNAGVMTYGAFETIDPARDHAEVMINITALVGLTHAFLPGMLERRFGGVINVASIAGFQPIPYLAVYAATKAFVISFSVALWEECRDRNVCVLGLCPGTTTTELFDRGEAKEAAVGSPRTVSQVVATALNGLDRKSSLVVDGLKNRLLSHGPRLIPRWFAARCAGQAVRPKRSPAAAESARQARDGGAPG
ncbi:SDR family NAD(P)-dependent oxidoreductase [Planctomyces sp. SH-PL14]|uniref:SDR family NAD(P)-dependent oxidoreductase n=1 Tax=Planctomyces sp. SH-PL14 TaxID=1632864 RepID=UPI00078E5032|nr:SDR family oxidoreductase [Planctomyces sp. SH-PL14]AMV20512.1 Serine 3-dehydrogenase [Planctomyces sp. SH-PL14]